MNQSTASNETAESEDNTDEEAGENNSDDEDYVQGSDGQDEDDDNPHSKPAAKAGAKKQPTKKFAEQTLKHQWRMFKDFKNIMTIQKKCAAEQRVVNQQEWNELTKTLDDLQNRQKGIIKLTMGITGKKDYIDLTLDSDNDAPITSFATKTVKREKKNSPKKIATGNKRKGATPTKTSTRKRTKNI